MRTRPLLAATVAAAALAGAASAQERATPKSIDDLLDTIAATDRPPGLVRIDAPAASVVASATDAAAQEGQATAQPAQAAPPEDDTPLAGRRRPGEPQVLPPPVEQNNPGAVVAPPPEAFPADHLPIPDRWRLVEAVGVKSRWWDPYNQNTYKGDRPVFGTDDWFIALAAISDTVAEPRSFPTPVGNQTTERPGNVDVFGRVTSLVLAQTAIASVSVIKGSTAYKPPDYEFRLTLAGQVNYVDVEEKRVLLVEPTRKSRRTDWFIGVQEAFIDYHIRNVSERYDFDSLRVGIQPFSSDFRGFLFQDNQFGVRFFGNRDNNRFQYNLAAFYRVEKDTNSGLNDVTQRLRDDFVFLGNLYRQDLPIPGLTSQISVVYNRNRERGEFHADDNGFPARPALIGNLKTRDYDVVYLGYNADGRIGRLNLTASAYVALGEDRNSIFTDRQADIEAYFVAVEPSVDFDWIRVRGSALWASGDGDPYDNTERGFDAIFENPQFAGSDTSYWIRQVIPFAGGGRAVGVNTRNGILNNLRSSKEEGQSNFNNPGTMLLGVGGDADVTPEWRVSANVNHLWFENTATVQALRQEGSIPKALGWDVSVAAIYRPMFTQNIVVRASAAAFDPGKGFSDLFTSRDREDLYYSVLLNIILTY